MVTVVGAFHVGDNTRAFMVLKTPLIKVVINTMLISWCGLIASSIKTSI